MQFLHNIYCIFCHCFLITISISSVFLYFNWQLKSDTSITNFNTGTETVIY